LAAALLRQTDVHFKQLTPASIRLEPVWLLVTPTGKRSQEPHLDQAINSIAASTERERRYASLKMVLACSRLDTHATLGPFILTARLFHWKTGMNDKNLPLHLRLWRSCILSL
jgi:hypothetical protein